MFQKIVAILCSGLLILACGIISHTANAEALQVTPTFYSPANDVPAWQRNVRDLSAETIQEMRGGTFYASLLPIDDDTLLFHGTFEYHNIPRLEAFHSGYDVVMPMQDAYAVAIDKQGERKWSLRISDPQSVNGFPYAWLLPDGRIMLWYYDPMGEWGSQYYIVSKEGEIQEMLPAYKVKAYDVAESLKPMHGGFFGGGVHVEDGGIGAMYDEVNLAFFDENLDLLFKVQPGDYLPGSYQVVEASDGFLIAGTRYTGFDRSDPSFNQIMRLTPIVVKVGLDGETIWTYEGHEYSATGVSIIFPTADGGALFLSEYDPSTPTLFDDPNTGALTKLDANGKLEWVRQSPEEPFSNFKSIPNILPYREGYLLSGILNDDAETYAVLYVSADWTPIQRIDLMLEKPEALNFSMYVGLVAAPDGNVFAHGSIITSETELAGMDEKPDCRLFYLSMDDVLSLE